MLKYSQKFSFTLEKYDDTYTVSKYSIFIKNKFYFVNFK